VWNLAATWSDIRVHLFEVSLAAAQGDFLVTLADLRGRKGGRALARSQNTSRGFKIYEKHRHFPQTDICIFFLLGTDIQLLTLFRFRTRQKNAFSCFHWVASFIGFLVRKFGTRCQLGGVSRDDVLRERRNMRKHNQTDGRTDGSLHTHLSLSLSLA